MRERFSKGGYIPGPGRPMRLVPEVSPDGQGAMDRIFADECFINKDRYCTRTDDMHRAVAIPAARWWYCPVHDDL